MESKLSFDFKTNQKIINKIAFIDSFKGRWTGLEASESTYLKELKQIATIESIGSSTRIEGATLTNDEVKKLIESVKIASFKTRDEQEVFGYYETLSLILESYEAISIKESHIHHLHKTLLQSSTKDDGHRGKYKKVSNKVVANYPGGQQKVIFNTTEPFLVKDEMDTLMAWTNTNLEDKEIHPLIVIGTFVYEFLSIHPYQDGNGRLSRLLTTLLLLKNDYDFMQYASMEIEIEGKKKAYYKALMSGQQNRGTKKETISDWLLFFFDMLEAAINKLEERYAKIKNRKSYLNNRQKTLLKYIEDNEPVKISDIIAALPDYTSYTLKKDVRYLNDEGLLKKIGKARATIYLSNDNEEKKQD
ncbi:MAG: Fic family protein [Bacteroidota bacterium]